MDAVFHLGRSLFYTIKGRLSCLQSKAPVGLFDESSSRIFVGLRMIDVFGHVNNAKFLELFEFARWNQGGQSRYIEKFYKNNFFPVVAGAHVQYMKEVKPWRSVVVRTKTVHFSGKNCVIRQTMYDAEEKIVHAQGYFQIAMVDRRSKKSISCEEALVRMGLSDEEQRQLALSLQREWAAESSGSVGPVKKLDGTAEEVGGAAVATSTYHLQLMAAATLWREHLQARRKKKPPTVGKTEADSRAENDK